MAAVPHLSNKPRLALITGASSGIGQAIARRLAQEGYRTILVARRAELLAQLAVELSEFAPSDAVPMDLTDVDAIPDRTAALIQERGHINVLVNCAGAGLYREFLGQSAADVEHLMRLNFLAPLALTRAVLPGMLSAASRGETAHVLNICSVSARVGPWGHTGYAASKAAMRSATETLEAETGPRGVHHTNVFPGIVDTPYFSTPTMPRLWKRVSHRAITPERVAKAAARIIGKPRVSLYVPAHYRVLDLIAAIAPTTAMKIVRSGSMPARTKRNAAHVGEGEPVSL